MIINTSEFTYEYSPVLVLETDLRFIADFFPDSDIPTEQEQYFRFFAGEEEIDFSDFSYTGDFNTNGFELKLTLVNPDQLELFENELDYTFQVWEDGEWHTEFDTGKLLNRDFSIKYGASSPEDNWDIMIASNLDARLQKNPDVPLVLYDPNRAEAGENEFETLKDTEGTEYAPEVIGIANLSLYKIFEEIADRLEFSGYTTNLPDYPIKKLAWGWTDDYISVLSQKIGMYKPLIYELDGKLRIESTILESTEGVPDPPPLTVDDYRRVQYSANSPLARAEVFLLDFDAHEGEYDETDIEIKSEFSYLGRAFDTYRTTIETLTYIQHFFKDGIEVRAQVAGIFKYVRIGTLEVLEVADTRSYRGNKLVKNVIIKKGRVPTYSGGNWTFPKQTILNEVLQVYYERHPFKPNEYIQKKMTRIKEGLVAVDSVNKVFTSEDFELGFYDAKRSGNITEDTTYRYGAISSVEEITYPTTKETLVMKVTTTDYLKQESHEEYEEPRTGDIGISDNQSANKPIIITAEPGQSIAGKKRETLSIDELPLEYGIPLARILLKRNTAKPFTFVTEVPGFIRHLGRASTRTLYDRDDNRIGAMIVEGFEKSGRALGDPGQREILTVLNGQQM